MITDTVLQAKPREELGKNAARRVRAAGRVPAAVYGEGLDALPVSVNARELGSILRSESGRHSIFTLAIDGKDSSPVKIHRIDLDPVTNRLLHMDLVRISLTETTQVSVSLEFIGDPAGVKLDGGILEAHLHEITVECLPRDIPASIQVDVSGLVVGDHMTVRQLPVDTDTVRIVTDPDHLVLAITAPRQAVEAEETPAPIASETPAAE